MNIRLATFVIGVHQRHLHGERYGEWVIEALINDIAVRREIYAMEIWDDPTKAFHNFCSHLSIEVNKPKG